MATFVAIELSEARLGLTYGVYRSDATAYKAMALCYSVTDANTIVDALNANQPGTARAANPTEAKPQETKEKKPRGRRKKG